MPAGTKFNYQIGVFRPYNLLRNHFTIALLSNLLRSHLIKAQMHQNSEKKTNKLFSTI